MYTVSTLAKAAGLSVDTVRYYSRLGLLPERGRTSGGHRYFDESAIERLQYIRGAQWFELRLEEIRELLDTSDSGGCPCERTKSLLEEKIAAIDSERERLDHIRTELARLLKNAGEPGFNQAAISAGANGHARYPERDTLVRRRAAIDRRLNELSG
jgi:DNA-binding transcriptional MerR regulator